MKRKSSEELNDDLRPHYDFDFKNMKPNRFAGMDLEFKGKRAIILDEDVAKVFDSAETVNAVLRSAMKAMRSAKTKAGPKPSKRKAS